MSPARADVLIVAHNNQDVHQELIDSTFAGLPKSLSSRVEVKRASDFTRSVLNGSLKTLPELIVVIGTNATLEVTSLALETPVISVAIPKSSYEEIKIRYQQDTTIKRRGDFSAIFLDQPVKRKLNLVKALLPEAKRVGVVLGPGTTKLENEIRSSSKGYDFELEVGRVQSEDNLIDTLDTVLDKSDVMLGFVDPVVFSRKSARNVLLTAYRWRVPLIGISPAYVKNGALASVHSTPEQIGKQLSEVLVQYLTEDKKEVPQADYTKYFSVSVNYQVAEALGIFAQPEDKLTQTLQRMEGSGK